MSASAMASAPTPVRVVSSLLVFFDAASEKSPALGLMHPPLDSATGSPLWTASRLPAQGFEWKSEYWNARMLDYCKTRKPEHDSIFLARVGVICPERKSTR